ncbi:hypothetical protein WOLCODRAFT_146214 [Wolfiporia cocos MD-104 SS10]|uniref:Uncharacterized protein n=1 Tax=Wolfiporia cocos (strain MD-104) TaxID=742152 RepID=A0A2H3J251_WOLCO|nr:hypothetical protein WOLCODRAFT_146214 [Wolfiporia cocos MD-104 SS10]
MPVFCMPLRAARARASSASSSPDSRDTGSSRTYRVGATQLAAPLVEAKHLQAYLRLLGAFRALRAAIEACGDARLPELVSFLDAPDRWAWFVGLAVERFQRWAAAVRPADFEAWVREQLPPVDVLMVWHAYMLSPEWYAEDCDRLPVMRRLKGMSGWLLPASIVLGDLTTYRPTPERVSSWFAQTNTPYDPLDAAAFMTHKELKCPQCEGLIQAPYVNVTGTGYTQQNFVIACPECTLEITRDVLALGKFIEDLVADHNAGSSRNRVKVYLAGTLRTETDPLNVQAATRIKATMLQASDLQPSAQLSRNAWKREIQFKLRYSILNIDRATSYVMKSIGAKRIMRRILSAYIDDRPFSIDLVNAVVRQGTFIDTMYAFGWTDFDYFTRGKDYLVLDFVVGRYHAYLDLVASSPASLFVPALDIDLAWHAHQLLGDKYPVDCLKLMSRYIDHDSQMEEKQFATAFDVTCRAWQVNEIAEGGDYSALTCYPQQRFGVPYMHCGCPLKDETFCQRLKRIFRRSCRAHGVFCTLYPPSRPDALAATHPCLHASSSTSSVAPQTIAGETPAEKHKDKRNSDCSMRTKCERTAMKKRRNSASASSMMTTSTSTTAVNSWGSVRSKSPSAKSSRRTSSSSAGGSLAQWVEIRSGSVHALILPGTEGERLAAVQEQAEVAPIADGTPARSPDWDDDGLG